MGEIFTTVILEWDQTNTLHYHLVYIFCFIFLDRIVSFERASFEIRGKIWGGLEKQKDKIWGKIGSLEMQILVTQMFLSFTTMVSQPNKCLQRHGNLSENPSKPQFS